MGWEDERAWQEIAEGILEEEGMAEGIGGMERKRSLNEE